jgi:hypothetical protein
VVCGESALRHHFFEVAVGELVSAIPPDTKKDDCRLKMAPPEGRLILLQEDDSGRMMDEPAGRL